MASVIVVGDLVDEQVFGGREIAPPECEVLVHCIHGALTCPCVSEDAVRRARSRDAPGVAGLSLIEVPVGARPDGLLLHDERAEVGVPGSAAAIVDLVLCLSSQHFLGQSDLFALENGRSDVNADVDWFQAAKGTLWNRSSRSRHLVGVDGLLLTWTQGLLPGLLAR